MDLNEISIFVKVVNSGSFAGAAKLLDMPKSTVSAKVSALEKRLGVTLIRRTTRKLHVTEAGQDYYDQCIIGLGQIIQAEEQVSLRQIEPQGFLKITAPIELGAILLPDVIMQFQKLYPKVKLDLMLTDRTVDLISEGIDLGIRAGQLKDSTLIAKKIGSVFFAPFASPKYIKMNGSPKTPKDLKNHRCILFSPFSIEGWQLNGSSGSQFVNLDQSLTVNDLSLAKSLAVADGGIALLPTFFCAIESDDKSLVRVLEDYKSNMRPVSFVYPQQQFVPKTLSAFIAVATEIIRSKI
jgi:DNA-binding transcriptional LysR family regulator